jgi:hypothetical protein
VVTCGVGVLSCALVKQRMLYVSAAYTGPRVNPVLCCGVFVAYGMTELV